MKRLNYGHPTQARLLGYSREPFRLEPDVGYKSGCLGGVAMTQITYVGKTNFRAKGKKFGIKRKDRRKHVYVVGKTGTGKTTLLKNMIVQDMQNGEGTAVIDPHGDLAESLLDFVPKRRINEVVYFNPKDTAYPVGLNLLEEVEESERHLAVSGLLSTFRRMFERFWGPRMEHILRNCFYALLDFPASTLLSVPRLLQDSRYRRKVVEKVQDPKVRDFWKTEYSSYQERFRTEAISPILNKVGKFLTAPLLRNIIGQPTSKIDFSRILNEGKILIANLSKGALGEENQILLGSLLVTRLQLAAMERVRIPEEERKDFYLYVDEFQNFSSSQTFESILSEARKYRLNLILAHQYLSQLDEEVRDAIFGNVGTIISFRVGAEDAEELEKQFGPEFGKSAFIHLPQYEVYLRLMIDGISSRPFSARTFPPRKKPEKTHKDKIIRVSRERYCSPREEVERKIDRWFKITERSIRRG